MGDPALIESVEAHFKVGTEYSRQEIQAFFKKHHAYDHNVTSYSYNRWNKGMTDIAPLFEHLDRGHYKYLGPKASYSGSVVHCPQKGAAYRIALWVNGELSFLNPKIKTFKEWLTSKDKGIMCVEINAKVTFREVTNPNLIQRKQLTDDLDNRGKSNGDFMYVMDSSPLGKLLAGKIEGDKFEFGDKTYQVFSIEY